MSAANVPTSTRLSLVLTLVAAAACADHAQRTVSSATAQVAVPITAKQRNTQASPSVMQRLRALDSSVVWEPQSAFVADIDCDGKADSVFVGRSTDQIDVAIIRAATPVLEGVPFGTHGGAQDAMSSSKARLTLESLDYDPRDADMGEIPGFLRSKTCQGLNLDDGDTDPVHFFWNHTSHHLGWWRE